MLPAWIALGLLALLGSEARAQGSRALAPASQASRPSWMPLEVGAYWELEAEDHARVTFEITECYEDQAGARWFYVHRDGGERLRNARAVWEAWTIHAGGVHRCLGRSEKGRAGYQWEAPTCVLALPVGIEAAWGASRTIEPPTQPEPPFERPEARYRAELLTVRERIEVPAGVFESACVRTVDDDGRASRLWFAAGVGIVRLEETEPGAKKRAFALVRHGRPGMPAEPDLAAAVRQALAADARLAALGPPLRLEQLRDRELRQLFKSRFCRVHWERESVLLRERHGRVDVLDAVARECWDRLLADEGVRLRDAVRDAYTKERERTYHDAMVATALLRAMLCLLRRTGGGVVEEQAPPELVDLVRGDVRRPTLRLAARDDRTLEMEILLGLDDAKVGRLGLK